MWGQRMKPAFAGEYLEGSEGQALEPVDRPAVAAVHIDKSPRHVELVPSCRGEGGYVLNGVKAGG